jgi:hypothetical protein
VKTARIMPVGAHRIGNACLSLQFDSFLDQFDQTYIVSPLSGDRLQKVFEQYNIDTTNFVFLTDQHVTDLYPEINNWYLTNDYRGSWLFQQALKLACIDLVDADVLFLQDADTFCTQPYSCVVDQQLNLFYQPSTDHQWGYYQTVKNLTGHARLTTNSFVCDMMPVFKQDWVSLKNHVNDTFTGHWLDTIIDQTPWDHAASVKWFSEYELLANWSLLHNAATQLTEQKRFEFKSLEALTHRDFPADFNVISDKNPQGYLLSFDYATDTVHNLDVVLDRLRQLVQP